jgi:hypothetical protein
MDPNLEQRLVQLEEKVEKTYKSVEKVRSYMFWTMIITIAVIVLPMIGLALVLPFFKTNYIDQIQSAGML